LLLAEDLGRFLAGESVMAPPYHFRLDEREITAARPGGVVLAAFIFFVVALGVSLFLAAAGLMLGLMSMETAGMIMFGIQALFAAAILAGGIAVGHGLLAARRWAWWVGVVSAVLLCVSTAAAVVAILVGVIAVATADSSAFDFLRGIDPPSEPAKNPDGSTHDVLDPRNFIYAMAGFYGLPFVVALVLWGTALWNLLSKSTAAWFRFAAEIRAEHRRVREQLAE
jgi:hypothetical protein